MRWYIQVYTRIYYEFKLYILVYTRTNNVRTVYMPACTLIITTLHFKSGLISLAMPVSISSALVPLLQSSILPDCSLFT